MISLDTSHKKRTHLRSSFLKLSKRSIDDGSIVTAGTSLLDVALKLSGCGVTQITVIDGHGAVLGFLSVSELEQEIEAATSAGDTSWKTRAIESLLLARLKPLSASDDGWEPPQHQVAIEDVTCRSIVEDGRLLGLVTDDDVFVSWRRIEELLSAATIDQLSGLMNRAAFMQRCREELDRSNRTGVPLVLVLFDMDKFKEVNDICGHPAGDRVIQQVAQCIQQQLRSYDVVGRLGGDEFAALCCQCKITDVAAPIRRIQASIDELVPPPKFPYAKLTLSIGAAAATGIPRTSVTDLYAAADECLYAAKRAGRNCAYLSGVEANRTPQRV